MRTQRTTRSTITLDLPKQQIAWLDKQATLALISRSGYVRQLIAKAMQQEAKS